jgi:ketosteroid isomerase-like protein
MLVRLFLVLLSLCLPTLCFSQNSYTSEIDQQVWKPFTKAIITQDAAAFIALHSKDVMRVEIDEKRVLNYDTYKANMESSWPTWAAYNKANSVRYTFELRFSQRMSSANQAFEIGYFRNESINANGEKSISYGQFHVALRKEAGTWKILVDSDSNLNDSITEQIFQAAKPIE